MNSDNCFEESTPKYLLDVKSPGFDMYTDNFEVTIKSETRETLFHKSDLVEETVTEGGQTKHYYYVCFDSEDYGPGQIFAIVKAYVPDNDFQGGIRVEVDKFPLIYVKPV